jgi:O-antigen/teichoic acid export membrane protein
MKRDPKGTRTRRFKLALLTSLAGKGISTIVQLAALPLAIAALGQERFGAYASLAAFLNWMSIVTVTITPGLTAEIVGASARGDQKQEGRAFGSAFVFSTVLAAVLCGGTLLLFREVGIEGVFGSAYLPFIGELQSTVTVLTVFIAMSVILSVADGAQAGYQSQYIHNVFLAIGNVLTILLIALLVRVRPTIANMIVAVYAAPLLARAMSLLQLVWSRRYLIHGMMLIDRRTLHSIAGTGAAFILTSVAGFWYQSFSVYWVGRSLGPVAAGQMAILITILNVLGSLLTMITQPLWPAIQDALVRNDIAWVRRAYLRISKNVMICVGIAALTIMVAGDSITHLWIKSTIKLSAASQIFLGLYFLLLAWEHLNYSVLIGLRRYWFASFSYFSGALIMLASCFYLVSWYGVSGMLAAMCSGPLFVTAWRYPLRLRALFAMSPPSAPVSVGEHRRA